MCMEAICEILNFVLLKRSRITIPYLKLSFKIFLKNSKLLFTYLREPIPTNCFVVALLSDIDGWSAADYLWEKCLLMKATLIGSDLKDISGRAWIKPKSDSCK